MAREHSPYLRRLLDLEPGLARALETEGPDAVWPAWWAAPLDASATGLRTAKGQLALIVALADLSGAWALDRVAAALSAFADRALDTALVLAAREAGRSATDGFTVLALGKLGARELNYSSDVDLILLHDREVLADKTAIAIAKRLVALMADRIAGRYVFRVDLRLRPASEATPPVLPVTAAQAYYESEALTWERIAFVRARACAGDSSLGERFLDSIRPFVWRRSLDFQAVADIRALSARMRDGGHGTTAVGPGFDLKRGAGGIREIEFFTHAHQLIYGGRDPALREPQTVPALHALAAAERVSADDAATLACAYTELRGWEHRLQMRADEQTHRLPTDPQAAGDVAALSGFPDAAALTAAVADIVAAPARVYARLLADEVPATVPRADAALRDWLAEHNAYEIDAVVARIAVWRSRRYRALRAPDAVAGFEAVLPRLLAALLGDVSAPGSLARFDAFLEALPGGAGLFGLLRARPELADTLAGLLAVSPALSSALARRPDLFDVVLSPSDVPDVPTLTAALDSMLADAPLDLALDRARRWVEEQRFTVSAAVAAGGLDPLAAGAALARIAEATVLVLGTHVAADFALRHGTLARQRLLTLAFGRFGGGLITPRSDLDLVFLFTGGITAESDGAKPLGATLYFNRLASRLVTAIQTPTPTGPLYEADTRLRPSGTQGLLAVSTASFAAYQQTTAWTWERMALTRARVLGGDAGVAAQLHELLITPRDTAALRTDVLAMRAEMARAHPPGGVWDVKHGRGGLIDIEFVVHFVQLRDCAGLTPDLDAAIAGTRLPPSLAHANALQTRVLFMARLLTGEGVTMDELPHAAAALLAETCGVADVPALTRALADAQDQVLAVWCDIFGEERA